MLPLKRIVFFCSERLKAEEGGEEAINKTNIRKISIVLIKSNVSLRYWNYAFHLKSGLSRLEASKVLTISSVLILPENGRTIRR